MLSKSFSNGFDGSAAVFVGLALFLIGSTAVSPAVNATEVPDARIHQATPASSASYSIRVPVVSAKPILTSRIETYPERDCKPVRIDAYSSAYDGRYSSRYPSQRDYYYDRGRGDNIGGQILGGLIGGAIGNQFGGGNGRKALTIAGALVGSSIARDARRGRDYRGRQQLIEPAYTCQTSTRERVIETVQGYDVTYSYNGALHVRRMSYDPGNSIELRVTAEPLSTPSSPSSRRTL